MRRSKLLVSSAAVIFAEDILSDDSLFEQNSDFMNDNDMFSSNSDEINPLFSTADPILSNSELASSCFT